MVLFLKKYLNKKNFEPKIKEETQLIFLKRLHRLLSNGYSLIRALEIMQWDKELERLVKIITVKLKKGYPLDQALEKAHFHKTIVAYLYFVRVNRNLLLSLEKCLIMFEQRVTYIKKFNQVIRYPIVLSLTFIFLLIFLKHSILPAFLELFHTHQESSRFVLYSIITIDFVSTLLLLLIVLLTACFLLWRWYQKKIPIESQIVIYHKIPLINTFLTLQTSYYFSTHMSMFLQAGLSLKDTLQNMSKQTKLPIVSYYTSLIMNQLANGFLIVHLLDNLTFIDKQLANVFHNNTNAETLAKDLAVYAEFLNEDMERKIMRIITMIQPIFFVFLACFIILVYVTLMWPMFQLIQSV